MDEHIISRTTHPHLSLTNLPHLLSRNSEPKPWLMIGVVGTKRKKKARIPTTQIQTHHGPPPSHPRGRQTRPGQAVLAKRRTAKDQSSAPLVYSYRHWRCSHGPKACKPFSHVSPLGPSPLFQPSSFVCWTELDERTDPMSVLDLCVERVQIAQASHAQLTIPQILLGRPVGRKSGRRAGTERQ